MRKDSSRLRRISEQIKRELATLFTLSVKDPRLQFITVNTVEVSADLGLAKVYVTSLDQELDHKELEKVLNFVGGYLRRELGRSIQIRVVPQLKFYYDESIERGARISSLIDDAIAEDNAKEDQS